MKAMSADFLNFYTVDALQPYVPLVTNGPWIVTAHGAVLHDCGGYGMMGLGQNPPEIQQAIGEPQMMANIMTPSFSQAAFGKAIREEVGHARKDGESPYSSFVCLNSGSEAVSFALRVADIHAKKQIDEGAHCGRKCVFVSLKVLHAVPAMLNDKSLICCMPITFRDRFSMRIGLAMPESRRSNF